MDVVFVIAIIGIIIAIGFLCEQIFRKTAIPDVLLLIFVGLSLRYVFQIVHPSDLESSAPLFTTFALLFILFQGSLSIDIRTLLSSAKSVFQLTFGSFIATAIVTALICFAFGFEILHSLLIGTILGGTSSLVVIPIIQSINLQGRSKPILVLESAISDILCIVFSVAILQALIGDTLVASDIVRQLFSSFGMSIFVGVLVGLLWVIIVERFFSLSHAYVVNIGMVLLLYAFVESPFITASGPIACLTFGIMLRNSKLLLQMLNITKNIKPILTNEAKEFYSQISFFLKTVFFVYLGILLDFTNLLILVLGAVIVIVIFFVRPWVVRWLVRDSSITGKERTLLEILIPKGFAAAILAQYASSQLSAIEGFAILSSQILNLALSVVFFSIILSSILVFLTQRGWFVGFYKMKPTKTDLPPPLSTQKSIKVSK